MIGVSCPVKCFKLYAVLMTSIVCWRKTEDNFFIIEMLIEMVKSRKGEIFMDIEKAYDRVNRKKLGNARIFSRIYRQIMAVWRNLSWRKDDEITVSVSI